MTSPSWLPTPEQQALLDACLLDEGRSQAAFLEWRRCADIDCLDHGSYRLLPLLWKRLEAAGIEDPSRQILKGVYRRTWYANQIVFAGATELIKSLQAAGIPVMLLKGAALTLANYRDEGLRPMDDIDVAVPRSFAKEAVETLIKSSWLAGATALTGTRVLGPMPDHGWTRGQRPLRAFDDAYFGARHAHGFQEPKGRSVDLHWFLFQGNCDPKIDAIAWANAKAFEKRGISALLPDSADHLLLLLVHGSRWSPIPTVRWIADSVTLVRTGENLDWNRFVTAARSRKFTLAVTPMLHYLESRFELGVPREVLEELEATPTTTTDRSLYQTSIAPPGVRAGLHELQWLYKQSRQLGQSLWAFPDYMRHVLGAESLMQVFRYVVSEIFRRIRRCG